MFENLTDKRLIKEAKKHLSRYRSKLMTKFLRHNNSSILLKEDLKRWRSIEKCFENKRYIIS